MKTVSRNKVKGVEIDGEFVSLEDLVSNYSSDTEEVAEDLSCAQLLDRAEESIRAAYDRARARKKNAKVLDIGFAMSGIERMRGAL